MENKEQVNHPSHYGGADNVYEAIKVIDAWDLGFSLGNAVKYISRAGKKHTEKEIEDLQKSIWYIKISDYPELEGKTDDEIKEYVSQNYYEMKPSTDSDYLASLYDEMMEQEIIKEKITDEETDIWFE